MRAERDFLYYERAGNVVSENNWGERSEPLLVRSMPNFLVIDRPFRSPGARDRNNARNYCVFSVHVRTNADGALHVLRFAQHLFYTLDLS